MKKLAFSLAFLSFSLVSFSQNCNALPTAAQTVHTNGIRAHFGVGGTLQYDDNGAPAFFPYFNGDQTPSTIYHTNMWFAGKVGSTIKVSNATYQNYRYNSGPMNDTTGFPSVANCDKWDKYWTVRRFEVEAHQRDFADNGRIDNPIPNIMAWPAVGNPNSLIINGFTLPKRTNGRSYAPFRDVDNDGIYNPQKGDFPAVFSGNAPQPDLISWAVFNDFGGFRSLNFEVQTTTYGYECADSSKILDNTLFSSYKIINHGLTDLDSFKIGLFTDFDLGCHSDDAIGCDTMLNTFFTYNHNPILDGSGGTGICDGGVRTFKNSIPVQAITFLNQAMTGFQAFSGVGNANPATTDPFTVNDIYNYLTAKWKDGTPLTRGGNGYNLGSTNNTNYMYPSDPYDSSATAWSMALLPRNSLDLRTLGITNLDKIRSGETKTLDIAYSTHRRAGRNAWQNVATMREEVAQIRQFYQTPTSNLLCPSLPFCEGTTCVWAGDANNDGIANYKDLLPIGVAQTQTGDKRKGNIIWSPRTATNWNTTLPDGNINAKHIDCDGNGIIELADVTVTEGNLQLTKPDFRRPNDVYTEGSNLTMTFDRDPDNLVFSLQSSYNFTATVNVTPTPDLFGLAFEVEYDPYFLKMAGIISNNVPAGLGQVYRIIDSSKIDGRKAQIECSRLGFTFQGTNPNSVLRFKLGVNETNFNWPTNITFLRFKNVKGIKRDGTIIPLGGKTQRVRFTDIAVDNKEIDNAKINIYPNPTTDETTVEWGKIAVNSLRLSNAMGQIVLEKPMETTAESTVLSLRDMPTGVYFLQIQTVENKTVVKKVILSR